MYCFAPVCYVLIYSYVGNIFWLQGVDINASIDGRLPIHYAADYGQKEVLNYLIDKGANIDVSINNISNLYWNSMTIIVILTVFFSFET